MLFVKGYEFAGWKLLQLGSLKLYLLAIKHCPIDTLLR
jgi:hypothetical protein